MHYFDYISGVLYSYHLLMARTRTLRLLSPMIDNMEYNSMLWMRQLHRMRTSLVYASFSRAFVGSWKPEQNDFDVGQGGQGSAGMVD